MRSVIPHLSPANPFRKYKALRSSASKLIIYLTLRKIRQSIFPVEEGYYKMSHPNFPCSCLEPAIPKGSPETDLTSLLGGLTGIICPAGASYLNDFSWNQVPQHLSCTKHCRTAAVGRWAEQSNTGAA